MSARITPVLSKLQHYLLLSLLASILTATASAGDRFLLCGPDEDACYEEIAQWCACIPYNELEGEDRYCLDFDLRTCHPLRTNPGCDSQFVFKNQATCLAVMFHSNDSNPCEHTTYNYCRSHNTPFCDPDGHPESCRT